MATGRTPPTPVLLSLPGSGTRRRLLALVVGSVVLLAACAGSPDTDPAQAGGTFHPDGFDGVLATPEDLYNPVFAGEDLPPGFRQLLGRDDILPVYQPRFVATAEAGWEPDELIIGVDLNDEARAYPVSFLNRREIVVDIHRGIPTFVTW